MTTFLQRDDFAVTARVLGALFYYSPESHETAPLYSAAKHLIPICISFDTDKK